MPLNQLKLRRKTGHSIGFDIIREKWTWRLKYYHNSNVGLINYDSWKYNIRIEYDLEICQKHCNQYLPSLFTDMKNPFTCVETN